MGMSTETFRSLILNMTDMAEKKKKNSSSVYVVHFKHSDRRNVQRRLKVRRGFDVFLIQLQCNFLRRLDFTGGSNGLSELGMSGPRSTRCFQRCRWNSCGAGDCGSPITRGWFCLTLREKHLCAMSGREAHVILINHLVISASNTIYYVNLVLITRCHPKTRHG